MTTGGRPIPVLAPANSTRRPGNRVSATAAPVGTPRTRAIAVAANDTRRVSAVIDQMSSSPPASSRSASTSPLRRTSTSAAQRHLVLARVREEQRLPELRLPEGADPLLRRRGDQPFRERLGAVGLHPLTGLRRHLDHVVDVEQPRVALAEHLQAERL